SDVTVLSAVAVATRPRGRIRMPSPFPGMDPYLEDPGLWPDVHHGLISQMQAVLNAQLRPKYVVRVEERVYVSDEDDPGREGIIPDLRLAAREGSGDGGLHEASSAAITEPTEAVTVLEDEIQEARLEVVDRPSREV